MQAAFNFAGPTLAEKQHQHLRRVGDRIGSHILAFLEARKGETFHMRELDAYVADRANVAPGSAGRVFRQLRRDGVVSVSLVSRSQSLYRVGAA